MTRAERKAARRELADWMRAQGLVPSGQAWQVASLEDVRDVETLRRLNAADGLAAKRLPDGTRLPGAIRGGDFLPEHGGTATDAAIVDPETGVYWVTLRLSDGGMSDVELPAGEPVAIFRKREAPAWIQEALREYRNARDAWEKMREDVAMGYAEENREYAILNPPPRYADFVREVAGRNREPVPA